MNIITNHVKGVQAGFQYPINQEVTKNADGSGGTIYKQTKKKSWYDSFAGWGHGILDVAGMIPAVGNIADGINAAWYAAEGDKLNAGLSLAAAVPGAGLIAGGAKIGNKVVKGVKSIDKASKAAKHTDPSAANVASKLYAKGGNEILSAPLELPKTVKESIGKNLKEGSYFNPFGNRPTKLTKGEKVLEYGALPIGIGVNAMRPTDNSVQPGSYKKQRYVGGVAPSGRQSLTSFNKFTNNTVYHGFNDRKDPVRKK